MRTKKSSNVYNLVWVEIEINQFVSRRKLFCQHAKEGALILYDLNKKGSLLRMLKKRFSMRYELIYLPRPNCKFRWFFGHYVLKSESMLSGDFFFVTFHTSGTFSNFDWIDGQNRNFNFKNKLTHFAAINRLSAPSLVTCKRIDLKIKRPNFKASDMSRQALTLSQLVAILKKTAHH